MEGDGDCVELDLTSPSYKWRNSQCSKKQPYVCRKLPLGRTFNCSCTGDSDSFNRGGYCKRWSADQPAWCYVSQVIRCPSLFPLCQCFSLWFCLTPPPLFAPLATAGLPQGIAGSGPDACLLLCPLHAAQ